jgi:hypothetical protein
VYARCVRRLVLLLALVACEKKPRSSTTTASGSAVDALVVVPAIDATAITIDAAEQLKTAEWPSTLEIKAVEVEGNEGRTNDYLRFRTQPPELGDAMNAWFKKFADSARSKRTAEQHCTVSTSSRIAVIGFCTHMNEMDEGGGGAPAGPDPTFFAWWMQPGLPAVTAEQLAPGVDFKALFTQTYAAAPKDCPLEHCTFEPGSFRLDDAGLTFESSEYCYADCLRPRVPLESLNPTHPWAKKLVEFLRQQVEKGEPVVKYVVKPL